VLSLSRLPHPSLASLVPPSSLSCPPLVCSCYHRMGALDSSANGPLAKAMHAGQLTNADATRLHNLVRLLAAVGYAADC
jgi:hypothetical protein